MQLKGLLACSDNVDIKLKKSQLGLHLPSVTSTGKPAVTPVQDKICGKDAANDFEPCVAESGQSLKSYQLKKLLTDAGWQILDAKIER